MHSTEIEAAARAWLRDNVVPGVSDAGRNALMLAYCAGALMKLDKMVRAAYVAGANAMDESSGETQEAVEMIRLGADKYLRSLR